MSDDRAVPDEFGQRLRSGAAQFAANLSPGPVRRVRARGDQRRRRKIAGSVAVVLLVVAGGGGTAYALGRVPQASAPVSPLAPTPAPRPAGTTILRLGPLTLRVPGTWRITARDAQGDYTVSTGSCPGDPFLAAEDGSPCPSFLLIQDAGSTPNTGGLSLHTYRPGTSFWTTSAVATHCPGEIHLSWLRRPTSARPLSSGYAPVTAAKTADYTVWRFGCYKGLQGPPEFFFKQRDWYLPVSRILVVDEYDTPHLAQILAAATWAG